MFHAAHRPSSKKRVRIDERSMRSRAVRRFFSCCRSMAFGPPPRRMCSSWDGEVVHGGPQSFDARSFDAPRRTGLPPLSGVLMSCRGALTSTQSVDARVRRGASNDHALSCGEGVLLPIELNDYVTAPTRTRQLSTRPATIRIAACGVATPRLSTAKCRKNQKSAKPEPIVPEQIVPEVAFEKQQKDRHRDCGAR